MRVKVTNLATTHVNNFNRVLTEIASHNLNLNEEVKALTLLSNLLTNWDVSYPTFTNGTLKLMLDDSFGLVLSGELRRKSIGLCIEENA